MNSTHASSQFLKNIDNENFDEGIDENIFIQKE